jgi:hypothetical protein
MRLIKVTAPPIPGASECRPIRAVLKHCRQMQCSELKHQAVTLGSIQQETKEKYMLVVSEFKI